MSCQFATVGEYFRNTEQVIYSKHWPEYTPKYERLSHSAFIQDHQNHIVDSTDPAPGADLLVELNNYLTYAGLQRPLRKVYILFDDKTSRYCAYFLVVVAINLVKRNRTQRSLDSDDQPFMAGVVTILQQINFEYVEKYFIKPFSSYILHCMAHSTA